MGEGVFIRSFVRSITRLLLRLLVCAQPFLWCSFASMHVYCCYLAVVVVAYLLACLPYKTKIKMNNKKSYPGRPLKNCIVLINFLASSN